jgi:hypothetical protein
MKEKIRSIYAEMQGYLAQVPDSVETTTWTQDKVLWDQLNFVTDELSQVSGKDYGRFKITPEFLSGKFASYYRIRYSTYKANLGGLIAKLHAEYFSDEEPPFRTMPSTIINQTQHQSQSISLILEIQEKILSEIPKHTEGSKERNFLEKFKLALPSIKGAMDILSSALKIGAEIGLDPTTIHKLLGL